MNEMQRFLALQASLTARESQRLVLSMRLATVSAVSEDVTGFMVDLVWDDADDTQTTVGARCLSPYVPQVNDVVRVVLTPGSGPLVVGTVISDRAFPNVEVDYNDLAGTTDFSSASYTSFSGVVCTLNKRSAHTSILVRILGTAFAVTAASDDMRLGALINGVDYDIGGIFYNTLSDHRPFVAENKVASGLAAGSYTVQFRIKRVSGTGAMRFDLSDFVSIAAQEVI